MKPIKCSFLYLRKPVRKSIFLWGLKFFWTIFRTVFAIQGFSERFERYQVKEIKFSQLLLGDDFQANPFNVRLFYSSARLHATSVYSGIVVNCVGF